ncbi:NAD(P)-dependent alcohol dehydrogenase [Hoeflea sp. G2-23]|uniref:NAD(P)-dependent alcohol dehydrogenase n=1 Tax=Hoeflea algicola TaxID=2983763 RepID=A0ABT3ZCE5_9HYPH|nr:NAD(P)-dependent alcohol dehydrogenase [Hoeflea algicola]MCY0148896.1 NAD(P)-dependent alcohol dehydrogenase [Hoeflea algicola]
MRAITYHRYGPPDVLVPGELPTPSPKPTEVLVRIHATTVTAGDYRARSLDMPPGFGLIGRLVFGLFGPRRKVLGTEFAGIVEAAGVNVSRFKPGDRVFAYPGAAFGGYAEYAVIDEASAIAHVPTNLDLNQAAALSFGGATALNFLRDKAAIKPGDSVLVIGASGGVGSAAVQLAKAFGAHVTGVSSTPHLEMVKTLGADRVIDYTREDYAVAQNTYDIILDTSGTATYAKYGTALKPGGRLLLVSADLWQLLASLFACKSGGRKVIGGYAPERGEDLRFLAELARAGKYLPHIGRRFAFDRIAEAHAYFHDPAKRGNIVVTLDPA